MADETRVEIARLVERLRADLEQKSDERAERRERAREEREWRASVDERLGDLPAALDRLRVEIRHDFQNELQKPVMRRWLADEQERSGGTKAAIGGVVLALWKSAAFRGLLALAVGAVSALCGMRGCQPQGMAQPAKPPAVEARAAKEEHR